MIYFLLFVLLAFICNAERNALARSDAVLNWQEFLKFKNTRCRFTYWILILLLVWLSLVEFGFILEEIELDNYRYLWFSFACAFAGLAVLLLILNDIRSEISHRRSANDDRPKV